MTFGVQGRRGGELPTEVTSFVGRTEELAVVRRMLTASRMVALTGPGGVGRTRVALRAVAPLRKQYPDGVHLVELTALKDPELLPRTVCAALGLVEQTARPAPDLLTEYLDGRRPCRAHPRRARHLLPDGDHRAARRARLGPSPGSIS